MPESYRTVSLPAGLLNQIDRTIDRLKKEGVDLGYNSRADFIKAAIRAYIKEVTQIYFLGEKQS